MRARGLRPRPDRRDPRVPQRIRPARLDAPPFRPRGAARGLFRRTRGLGPERPAQRRGRRGFLPAPRQYVGAGTGRVTGGRRSCTMKIRALLEQSGKTAVGFSVPEDVVLALGKGKRPPVNVTINGYTYRSTVAPMGGGYMVGVS